MENKTDKVLDIKSKSASFVKDKAFDIVAIVIIVSMTALSLGVIELRDISWRELVNIVLECIPFYLAATLLSVNYYTKGTFMAKQKDEFTNAVTYYSAQVNSLTGEHMNYLPDFCCEYNEKTLKTIRESMLRSVAITWKLYDEGIDGRKPLKICTRKELTAKYGKEVTNVICKCKKLKIKGLHANLLLGNINTADSTDLGPSEKQLANRRTLSYVGMYALSVFFMGLMAVKDVLQWGWMGAFLTLFKISYIACGACMKYFNGYEDILINVVSHMYRKTDVIKEFYYWYDKKFNGSNKSVD